MIAIFRTIVRPWLVDGHRGSSNVFWGREFRTRVFRGRDNGYPEGVGQGKEGALGGGVFRKCFVGPE